MVGGNGGNKFRQYAGQNVRNHNGYNVVQNVRNQVVQDAVQNPGVQNVSNQNRLIVVSKTANQNPNGNGNFVASRAEGNVPRNNGYQIRCYNCRGLGHFARNCTVTPMRRDAAYLQTQLLIAQKKEAGIQLQAKKFDLMATTADLDEIEEVNVNCILMKNLQQPSTPGTQTDKAPIYDSEGSTESREELYFSNTSKIANVSKPISIPNEEFLDDTTPSVARKFLNEVKSTIMTLQRVVKHRMTLDTHNWSSSAHQELYKIVKDEIFPIVNQVDARVQNFEIQFLKDSAKFVRDFKSLTKEADESLAKHKALELKIERLLRAVENAYAKLWNDWYKKCKECKYDKISYDKAYNDMQQKIERLQAQLGDLNGQSKDTSCVSDTLNPLSQKLENENVELKFEVGDTHALSNPVTSNSIPPLQESKVMKNDKVIAPGMFRINPFKPSRKENYVPNKVRASIRTNPITASRPPVITKKVVNSDSNGLSSTGVDNTAKTRRPQPRSNTKNDRVPSASKSSYSKNKDVEVEEHPRNLFLFKNKKHMSTECMDLAKITKKGPKPDKIEHEIKKIAQKPDPKTFYVY
nr:hypothetical protein [Tanacetum cinerariifolium]